MKKQQCPECGCDLDLIEVAPCWDCGHVKSEVMELNNGEHEYFEYRAFGSLKIVLCDFCDADFGSYNPEYFGLPKSRYVIGNDCLELQRKIYEPSVGKDLFCCKCKHRLAFIKFKLDATIMNKKSAQQGDAPESGSNE